ncbi:hypothetical protein PVK06_011173 [Gossypium arboreum]|uniref:Aminotransferase-like plant mobile domain-containing protein n=1 Tax=Gossypium arboreum TaxID=29729 RepID=A0ABR0Q8H3_GOSAR|nr:hypothetical protein PVK06_011173 [Gossypium arboreum]
MLYRELCRTTKPDAVDMGGCLILLQSWAFYRMLFLALVSHQPYIYPLVNRWSIYPGIGRSYTVPIYRLMIEQHAGEGFIWMPYRRPEITVIIPSSTYVDSHLWCTNAPIISFNVVEWYYDSLVASSTSRIRQCRWGRRFTVRTREGDMDSIGGLRTGDMLRGGRIGWLEDLRWICLPICDHR